MELKKTRALVTSRHKLYGIDMLTSGQMPCVGPKDNHVDHTVVSE